MIPETKLEAAIRRTREVFTQHKTEALTFAALGFIAGAVFF